jgi:serine protease
MSHPAAEDLKRPDRVDPEVVKLGLILTAGALAVVFDTTIVSVALNPNRTDALFSNAGPWVRTYVPGAAVVSTMPAFRGGYEPVARTQAFGRIREAIDPDDFRSGFAVWSGTSFSAPIMAGDIAASMLTHLEPAAEAVSGRDAVTSAWDAVSLCTGLARS